MSYYLIHLYITFPYFYLIFLIIIHRTFFVCFLYSFFNLHTVMNSKRIALNESSQAHKTLYCMILLFGKGKIIEDKIGQWFWGTGCVRYAGRWWSYSRYWLFYVKFKNCTFWSRKSPVKPGISFSENKKILQEWCKHIKKLMIWLKWDPISKI